MLLPKASDLPEPNNKLDGDVLAFGSAASELGRQLDMEPKINQRGQTRLINRTNRSKL